MNSHPSTWNYQQASQQIIFLFLLHPLLRLHNAAASAKKEPWKNNWRLPNDSIPSAYNLLMEARIEEGTFRGHVDIFYRNTRPKDHVVLHSKYLNVTQVHLSTDNISSFSKQLNQTNIKVKEWIPYPKYEFLIVMFDQDLKENFPVKLSINFTGSLLKGKLNGFYRSQYTVNGQTKYLATTKFEPNHARKAFPCFDEPGMKATFDIELVKFSPDISALSNAMEMKEEYKNDTGGYVVSFRSLSPVPTYTICFIISEFKVVERGKTDQGVEIRGMAREGHEGSMKYATDMTKKSVEFFEHYLALKYPLAKLDIIGIPDFASGAMENFGLITFKDTNVLTNPITSGYMDYFAVVNVVCHEVAHMWFGNLITMKWWNDIWLNEGFATFFSMKCTKALQPELNVDEVGFVKKKLVALVSDTPQHSIPIISNVTSNDQLSGIFNDITYKKGHSMLEMLEDYLGEEKFRLAIQTYVARYQNMNSDTPDLIESMEYASGLRLYDMMNDWTTQAGYPVIDVKKTSGKLTLTQKRFTNIRGNDKIPDAKWNIPISFKTSSKPNATQRIYFHKTNKSVTIELENENDWFKINTGGIGFYRVNYPENIWESYQERLFTNNKIFKEWSDRANLLDDACNLASAGHIKYETSLSLFAYLQEGKERNYAPWRVTSKCLNDIKKRLPSSGKTSEMFHDFVRKLMSNSLGTVLDNLNKTKSSPFDYNPTNEVIFSLGCSFKHPQAIDTAKILFDQWLNKTQVVNPNIRPTIFRYGLNGDEVSKWEQVWERYKKADDPHELRDLRISLTSVKSPDLLKRLVVMSKNDSLVRTQDYYGILITMAAKKKTNDIVWDLFRNEYKDLEEKFSGGKLSKLFQAVASNFSSKNKLKEVKDFLREHPSVVPEKRNHKKIEENISNNMKWRETHEKDLRIWLNKRI